MANTNKGITYPTSGDNIAPLETHFANLASTADNAGVASGVVSFTGPTAVASPATVTITLPFTLSAVPKVTLTVGGSAGSNPYIATVYSTPSTTSIVAKVHCISSIALAESLNLYWMASTFED
jgi:predicted secreted protein